MRAVSPYLRTRQFAEVLWGAADGDAWPGRAWPALAAYAAVFAFVGRWGYRRDEGERFS